MPTRIEVIAMHNKVQKGNYGLYISEEKWEEKCKETDELLAEIERLKTENEILIDTYRKLIGTNK